MHKVLSISYFPPHAIVGFLPARGSGGPRMAVFSRPGLVHPGNHRFPGTPLREARRSAFLDRAEENRTTDREKHPSGRGKPHDLSR